MSARSRFITSVTLAYAALATIWIFLSDRMLSHLADVQTVTRLATVKGMLFIALTSGCLLLALRYVPAGDAARQSGGRTKGRPLALIGVLIVSAATIAAIAVVGHQAQTAMLRETAMAQLEMIARANVDNIEGWLTERRANVRQVASNIAVARLVQRWQETGSTRDRESIAGLLENIRAAYRFSSAELWDANGHCLVDAGDGRDIPLSIKMVTRVLRGEHVTEDVRSGGEDFVRLLAPLHADGQRSGRVIGILAFVLRPNAHLPSLLDRWPQPVSGELVLSRRDGDDIVIMNGERQESRVSRQDPRLVGVQAHVGTRRIFDAVDHRGVRVLAASDEVAGTRWVLVAKVDEAEALSSLHGIARNTILLLLAALAVTLAVLIVLWQRQQLRAAMTEVVQARAVEAAETRFRATFEQAAVGILHADFDGRFLRVNQRLCAILGYEHDELLSKRFDDLRHPDEPCGEAMVADLFGGGLASLHDEQRYLRKDGTDVWLAFTTSLARDSADAAGYLIVVVEDISQRVAAKEALRKSEERFQLAMRGSNDGIWDHDLTTDKVWLSPRCNSLLGHPDEETVIDVVTWGGRVYPDDRQRVAECRHMIAAGHQDRYEVELRSRHKDGHWVDVLSRGFLVRNPDGTPIRIVGTHVDISGRKAIEKALRERVNLQEFLGRIADSLPGALVSLRKDSDGSLSMPFASPKLYDLYGHHPADVAGDATALFASVHADDVERARGDFIRSAARLSAWHGEYRIDHPTKGVIWIECHSTPEREADGAVLWHGYMHDITERRRREDKLRQAMTVFESTREGVVITDAHADIVAVNPAFTAVMGYDESEVVGRNMRVVQSGRHDRAFYRQIWSAIETAGFWQGEIWNRRKNGEIFPARLGVSAVRDDKGAVVNYVGTMSDVTHIKESETRLDHLVHHDPLTDLPNRLLLRSRIDHAVARARRNGSRGAVMVLDLDRFKTVNESLGYHVGDRLLCAVATRMVERLRDIDTTARLGADEFGILLEDLAGADDAERVAESLAAALAEPFNDLGKREVYTGVSIGVTLFPDDGDDADRLLQNAETALNEAKTSRGAAVFYTSLLTTAANARIELEANLRLALERGEFILHYQPLVTIGADHVKGVEALVRWAGPGGSSIGATIPPSLFIPVAEETGLIVPLGEWVLRTACVQMRTWIEEGLACDFVSVNLSPVQFLEPDLPERVAAILIETGLPADHLELEITEGVLLDHTDESQARLARLKALGVRLAVDDFGIGYSSLGYLKRLPIDKLKIDKSFIDDLPGDAANVKIVTAVISLAHSLRLEVLAEGVENKEQLLFLRQQGCDSAQGFLFSKPLPASELPDAVRHINKRRGRSRRGGKSAGVTAS